MANNISGRVWTLDTPEIVYDHEVKILFIEFLNYSVSTDEIVLQDRIGRNLWDARGSLAFDVVRSGRIGWSEGLTFVSITPGSTGVVKVYIE